MLESWITNSCSLGPGEHHCSGTAWGSVPGLHSWGFFHCSFMQIPFRGVPPCPAPRPGEMTPHTLVQHGAGVESGSRAWDKQQAWDMGSGELSAGAYLAARGTGPQRHPVFCLPSP